MTRIYDDPAHFSEDMLAGFTLLHGQYVMGVPGGVIRATEQPGKVAVVVGGGSGHYPAFCGLVGKGFADGAVVGNIFTSPSTADATSVARAVHSGAGLLFITGNYAGDVMNFTLAAGELETDGIDARYVVVTDDIASAPPGESSKRRGIAGDFIVFKVACGAAEQGYDLEGVERIARLANERTRSLGVAFEGCTLPGANAPLFSVPDSRMGLGLGIHGEPGIAEEALPRAGELAAKLVDGILADRPDAADRKIAVVLNGLGQTKYEELFILWAHVARLLAEAGLDLVEPDVGELVTSLDMAGCSLTVTWLNEELELLWRAPADTPAYKKKGWPPSGTRREPRRSIAESTPKGSVTERQKVSPEDHACSLNVVAAIAAMATAMEEAAESLGKLDAVAGDGDHGRGMTRGTRAALESARATQEDGGGPGHVLAAAGRAWADSAGGTSGLLWGAALTALGRRLVESAPLSLGQVAAGVEDAYSEIARLGHAKRGDKTMLDALGPFSDALSQCADDRQALPDAWSAAAAVARKAANETASLRPQVGRARPLAARSVGSPDPGAVSLALCVAAVADVLRTGR